MTTPATRDLAARAPDLAARARELAAAEPRGSLGRRAYGCAAVAIGETKTLTHARRVLDDWDGPDQVKSAALAAVGELAGQEEDAA